MSKKILFTASTMSHLEHFHKPYMKAFEEMGYQVTALALPVSKSFISLQNLRAILSTRKIIREEGFDIISSHATLAGVVTRLAVMILGTERKRMRIFHTAHGYLFHDNKSLKKWAYLLPEILCAKVTDVLMVMNQEDLEIAGKYRLGGKKDKVYYIDGMGLDLHRFHPMAATIEQKKAFRIADNDFTYVYVGEFSKRKNHRLLLNAFAQAIKHIESASTHGPSKKWRLVLAGDGALHDEMKGLAKDLGIFDRVIFLGYIRNVQELYTCCDVAVTTSRIEGLPFNVMEAMSCGLPVVASDIKGHKELVTHGENGLLFESDNETELVDQLLKIYENKELKDGFGISSLKKIRKYSLEEVFPAIIEIYKKNIAN